MCVLWKLEKHWVLRNAIRKIPCVRSATSQGSESESYVRAVGIRETPNIQECCEEGINVFGLWRLQSLRRNPMFLRYGKRITQH